MDFAYKLFGQCIECRKMFAMKKLGKELLRTEDINIAEVLYQPHPRGTQENKVERLVPGEIKVYEITYVCRFCGMKHSKITYRSSKK